MEKHATAVPALPLSYNADQAALAPANNDEKYLPPVTDVPTVDGHADLTGAGAFAAILKGDVVRHLTVFERKAALINA
jgi:hypothetical protein